MKLIEYMPPFLQNILEYNKIFETEDVEIENMRFLIDKILSEVIVKKATSYGLEKYERIYGIKNKAQTIEARRMEILFKMNNKFPYTVKWLRNTLDESIGKDNYILKIKDYELYITINLEYTEAAEMLKKNLIRQIPANIKLEYDLQTKLNEYMGASIARQDYINLNAVAIETKENLTIQQINNFGANVSHTEYVDINFNTEALQENENLDLRNDVAFGVARQDYIDLDTQTTYKEE